MVYGVFGTTAASCAGNCQNTIASLTCCEIQAHDSRICPKDQVCRFERRIHLRAD